MIKSRIIYNSDFIFILICNLILSLIHLKEPDFILTTRDLIEPLI